MKQLTGVTRWAMLTLYERQARVKRWRQIWKVDPTYVIGHCEYWSDYYHRVYRKLNALKGGAL